MRRNTPGPGRVSTVPPAAGVIRTRIAGIELNEARWVIGYLAARDQQAVNEAFAAYDDRRQFRAARAAS